MAGPITPFWKFFLAALDGTGITEFSELASSRVCEVTLNAPLSLSGNVSSDNPQVWIPYDDDYDDPYLDEGTRILWGFRRESDTPPYYTVRAATLVQLVEDSAQGDDARTQFQGFDPWHYMFSRPVCDVDGNLPGKNGLSFSSTEASVIIGTLLSNTIVNHGHAYIDAGALYGGTGFWAGTLETGPGMVIDINFPQGTTVGQAWQMITNIGVCDIILAPIYDPLNRADYLVDLSVYAQAGVINDTAIFAWNAPGRSLQGLNRQQDGSSRANKVKFFAGQGGSAPGGRTIPVQTNAASALKFGQYWALQFFPAYRGAAGAAATLSLAQGQLRLRKQGRQTVTITPAPERSPRPWIDFGLGDRVPVWALPQGFRKLLGEDI